MMELRTGEAASMLAQGHSCTVTTTEMAEKYGLSRRQARRITARAMDLIIKDFEEINFEPPQIAAKLLLNLEQGIQKKTNQIGVYKLNGSLLKNNHK